MCFSYLFILVLRWWLYRWWFGFCIVLLNLKTTKMIVFSKKANIVWLCLTWSCAFYCIKMLVFKKLLLWFFLYITDSFSAIYVVYWSCYIYMYHECFVILLYQEWNKRKICRALFWSKHSQTSFIIIYLMTIIHFNLTHNISPVTINNAIIVEKISLALNFQNEEVNINLLSRFIFSSPELKSWVSISDRLSSTVHPSVCFHLLFRHYLANFNQTWHRASLDVEDSSLFKYRVMYFSKGR